MKCYIQNANEDTKHVPERLQPKQKVEQMSENLILQLNLEIQYIWKAL